MSQKLTTALSVSALTVAVLGWTPLGEAAKEAAFPVDSVGTPQLRANAVTSPKIRNGSVTALDIQKRAITSVHVKPGSLVASNFKAGQLPAGPKGEKGERGANGVVSAFTKITGNAGTVQPLATAPAALASLSLPAGRYALFGRVQISWDPVDDTFFGICTLSGGGKSELVQISGRAGGNAIGSLNLLVELGAAGTVTLACNDLASAQARWSRARLTALEVNTIVEQ